MTYNPPPLERSCADSCRRRPSDLSVPPCLLASSQRQLVDGPGIGSAGHLDQPAEQERATRRVSSSYLHDIVSCIESLPYPIACRKWASAGE